MQPTSRSEILKEKNHLSKDYRSRPKELQQYVDEHSLTNTFLTIRKFPGIPLSEILTSHDINTKISAEDRLKLTIALLRALKEQVHDLGLIHRDIKPANIIVDLSTMEVNIIDLGLSIRKDQNDGMACGSIAYISPEMIDESKRRNLDQRSDIFSMGRLLARLWGGDYKDQDAMPSGMLENKILSGRSLNTDTLFGNDIIKPREDAVKHDVAENDVTKNDAAEKIRSAIVNMHSVQPDGRDSINLLMEHFHKAYLHQTYSNFSDNSKKALFKSFRIGVIARNRLIKAKDKTKFCRELKIALKQIDDSETSIKEFAHGLGWHSLQSMNAKSKDEISIAAQKIIQDLHSAISKYNNLLSQAINIRTQYKSIFHWDEFSEIREFMLELNQKLDRIASKPFDLDLLQQTTNSLNNRYQSWNDRFVTLKDDLKNNDMIKPLTKNLDSLSAEPISPKNNLSDNAKEVLVENPDELKNALREALRKYMGKTLSYFNILIGRRAASQDRQNDIEDFASIIDTANTKVELITRTKNKMRRIDTGLFPSTLVKKLQKAIDQNHEKTQHGKKGKSK